MGRLIDAEVFINWLDCGHLRSPSEKCLSELDVKQMIDNQPVAYDVNKVVEELKGMSGIQFDGQNESYELNWCISTDRAIEIVKGAVKDE